MTRWCSARRSICVAGAATPHDCCAAGEAIWPSAAELGAHEHTVFGGRVDEDGGFTRKNMARNTPPELRDRRDWDDIRAWARQIAATVGSPARSERQEGEAT